MNIANLNKSEIVKLANTKCRHYKSLLEHPKCNRKENTQRIGYLDIECTELNPAYGFITTYCILDDKTKKIYHYSLSKKDIEKYGKKGTTMSYDDTGLLKQLVIDMRRFDKLILHFGCYFDVSYIRTRAIICGVKHPIFGEIYYADTWKILRSKFSALKSKSLENSLFALTGKTSKTKLNQRLKNGCIRGEKKSLDITLDHCMRDVRDTKKLYDIINPYIKPTNSTY